MSFMMRLIALTSAVFETAYAAEAQTSPPAPIEIHEIAYLKPSTLRPDSWFGTAVSVSGDTFLAGAYGEPRYSAPNSGAAYVYVRLGDEWIQQARLKPATNQPSEGFGLACGVWKDTAVVGSFGASGEGAVFVFQRVQNTWTQQCWLKPRAAARNDDFGRSVAISDGIIVVGAPQDRSRARTVDGDPNDNGGISVGAAYIFEQTATGWQQRAYLKASDNRGGSFFGGAVAASSNTVVVGAWGAQGEENTAKQDWICGAAYVFVRTNGLWRQQACLTGLRDEAGGKFGWSVAISGNTIVVGAEDDSIQSARKEPRNGDCGAAYIFERANNQWNKTAYLTPTRTMPGGYFGERVALDGDRLVVTSSLRGGTANLFYRRKSTWQYAGEIVGSNVRKGDYFGSCVAISGRRVVVGAAHDSSTPARAEVGLSSDSFKEEGAVYVFQIPEQLH